MTMADWRAAKLLLLFTLVLLVGSLVWIAVRDPWYAVEPGEPVGCGTLSSTDLHPTAHLMRSPPVTPPPETSHPKVLEGWAAYMRGDFATARDLWMPLAETGDPEARFRVGWLHHWGEGVPRDLWRAADWYEKTFVPRQAFIGTDGGYRPAHDGRHGLASASLALLLVSDESLKKQGPRDPRRARALLRPYVDRGDEWAIYLHTRTFIGSRGTLLLPDAALELTEGAIEKKEPLIAFLRASILKSYFNKFNSHAQQIIKLSEFAMQNELVQATEMYLRFYRNLYGSLPDDSEELLRSAADKGAYDAATMLAELMRDRGLDSEERKVEAAKWAYIGYACHKYTGRSTFLSVVLSFDRALGQEGVREAKRWLASRRQIPG